MSSTIQSPRAAAKVVRRASDQTRTIEETIHSLRALLEGDEEEQRETFAFLKQALDEDRPSSRKLFSAS